MPQLDDYLNEPRLTGKCMIDVKTFYLQVHLPSDLMCSGISPIFSSTGHNIELILQIELPLVASAFKMSGFTPAQVSLLLQLNVL